MLHPTNYSEIRRKNRVTLLCNCTIGLISSTFAIFYYWTVCNPLTDLIYWKAASLIPPIVAIALTIVLHPNIITGKDRITGYSKDPPTGVVTTLFFTVCGLIITRSMVKTEKCVFLIADEIILHCFIITGCLLFIIGIKTLN